MRIVALGVAAATTIVLSPAAAGQAAGGSGGSASYDAVVRRDGFGVPHVVADDYPSLGFGIGYAFAEDNLCTLMDYTVTVRGERSRFFGPDETWEFSGNGTTNTNLASDFHYTAINESGVIEELLDAPPPNGPLPQIRDAVRGYVAGINTYLNDIGGADGVTDPRCAGAEWVRPLTEMDAYRRFFQLASLASSGVAIEGIGTAQPPGPEALANAAGGGGLPVSGPAEGVDPDVLAGQLEALQDFPARFHEAIGIGSNAYALGRDATDNGRGMVLGNPHFPWQGGERLYQMHLTIPGVLNVSGAGLYGVPLVLIGHTEGVAWSHTVSTAFRFTPFELTLVPGDPTSYLVDGQPEQMESREITVEVREPDGSLGTRTRTLWSTRYGPMLTSVLGLPLFPWTPAKAYALGDANRHIRYLNQFFTWNHAQSTEELFELQQTYLGIPWVNTIAADRDGDALYSDVSVVPHVTDDKATTCSGVLGLVTFPALGLPTLDGSRSECAWGSDPDAPAPGIFGPSNLPHLFRDDYVTNSNDSYWLSNPAEPLEGFARIIGDERTARTLRTRLGLVMVEERLAGADEYVDAVGGAGDVYTQDVLQATVFNNRQHAGELTRDEVVALCQSLGGQAPTSSGPPVSTEGACDALAGWDLRDDLDSSGAILFRRFWSNLTASPVPVDLTGIVTSQLPAEVVEALPLSLVQPVGAPWEVPFDVADPVHTPRDLDTSNPRVAIALGDAISDLDGAGIPLDAGLRGWQYEVKDGEAIPIHGGPGGLGVFNAINVTWDGDASDGAAGYPDVDHGSSFVMAAQFVDPADNGGCPVDADAIVTYSQSEDVTRPYFANQTRMYTDKQWNPMYFCEAELRRDPGLTVTRVRGSAGTPADPADPAPAPDTEDPVAAPAPARRPLPATGGGLGLAALATLAAASRLRPRRTP